LINVAIFHSNQAGCVFILLNTEKASVAKGTFLGSSRINPLYLNSASCGEYHF